MELLHARLGELQQEMKSLVKRGMKAGVVDEKLDTYTLDRVYSKYEQMYGTRSTNKKT